MQRPEVKIAFAAFEIAEDLHVTIGRRYDATEAELLAMKTYVDEMLRPHLPFKITFGNFCYLGESNTIPVYRVYFEDPFNLVKDFYQQFYKEADGKPLYPKPKFHVTVDTPEKRRVIETLIRHSPTFELLKVSFKSRVEGGAVDVDDKSWKCQTCGNFNPLSQKECLSRGCDQWRPVGISNSVDGGSVAAKPGDWTCCGYNNFASRATCAKCGRPPFQPVVDRAVAIEDAYALPPSAPAASVMPAQEAYAPIRAVAAEAPKASYFIVGGRGDWMCVRCNFKIFGSKDRCKCGTRRP